MKPSDSILPILRLGPEGEFRELLGTGFLAGAHPVMVTAAHVFDADRLEKGETFSCAIPTGTGSAEAFSFQSEPLISDEFDVAAVKTAGLPDRFEALPLASNTIPLNRDVLTYEFSTTHRELTDDGTEVVRFETFAHKGNITRYFETDQNDVHPGTPSFNTSFSVLQGASGAPVINGTQAAVVGMLTGTREMELQPAQVVTAQLEGTDYEEVKYFLPMGVAARASVVIDFLQSIGESPTLVEV